MKVVLCDVNSEMIKAWEKEFKGIDNVTVTDDNIFNTGTEAIVSPANAHGYMRGGFDRILAEHFGKYTELMVQNKIIATKGEMTLPVGETVIVDMEDGNFDKLVVAPTMPEAGMYIAKTANVFLASVSIFKLLKDGDIESVTITGLGTGVGGVPVSDCAKEMRQAYKTVFNE
jgi:O-acetyl-ADP-ribose deacetylase (regulator of RNase III)